MTLDLKKLLATLKSLEYRSEGEHCSVCPSCNNCAHQHGDRKGHDPDCELAAAIRDVERELEAQNG